MEVRAAGINVIHVNVDIRRCEVLGAPFQYKPTPLPYVFVGVDEYVEMPLLDSSVAGNESQRSSRHKINESLHPRYKLGFGDQFQAFHSLNVLHAW